MLLVPLLQLHLRRPLRHLYGGKRSRSVSVYFLHPSENPSLILVSTPLNGSNYHSWARAMKMSLLSKNKLKFVDRSILAPLATDPLFSPWERCNTMVLSWLTRSLEPSIAQSILWIDKAYEVWDELRERFSHGDLFRIADLQDEISFLKQGDLNVTRYFTELKTLWDELEIFRPPPVCRCASPCVCGAISDVQSQRHADRVIKFLRGLNDQFAVVRSQLMLLDPLPPLNKVFSLVIQQERQFLTDGGLETRSLVNAVESSSQRSTRSGSPRPRSGSGSGAKRLCSHCGRTGHTVDTCYKKHGYPPGYKPRNSQRSVNAAVTDFTGAPGNDNQNPSFTFTEEQYRSLLALLPQHAPVTASIPDSNRIHANFTSVNNNSATDPSLGVSGTDRWILDTGATDHICNSLSFFIAYKRINPVCVNLPNGQHVFAYYSGTVHFSPDLYLYNVLFVPQFSINLISVHKLAHTLECKLIFSSRFCHIQDLHVSMTIGLAEVVGGLYQLKSPTSASCNTFTVNSTPTPHLDVWHFRLGHVSDAHLRHLHTVFPYISIPRNNSVCDICHFSKQKRLPFPVSTSKSNKAFELIHCDIWGPIATPSIHGHKYFLTIVDDFTRFTWIFLLKLKSDAQTALKHFISLTETV